MRKTFALNFVLPLLLPMGLAGLLVRFGGGPDSEDIIADLNSQDPEVRENALDWLQDIRRPSLLDEVSPFVLDPDLRVAKQAVEVIRRTGSPHSLPVLDEAWEKSQVDRHRILRAYGKIRFPQTLPHLEQHFDDPDPEVAATARKYAREVRVAINHEIVFFSLGNPIYNKMGHLIYSQALLFPEGRQMVAGTTTEPLEDAEKR